MTTKDCPAKSSLLTLPHRSESRAAKPTSGLTQILMLSTTGLTNGRQGSESDNDVSH